MRKDRTSCDQGTRQAHPNPHATQCAKGMARAYGARVPVVAHSTLCAACHTARPPPIPTISLVGVTQSLQCLCGSGWPAAGRQDSCGEHLSQTQRPHFRQWCRQLKMWKSSLQSSHLGASRFGVHCRCCSEGFGAGGRIAVSSSAGNGRGVLAAWSWSRAAPRRRRYRSAAGVW